MSEDILEFASGDEPTEADDVNVAPREIPLDASPHMWMHHKRLAATGPGFEKIGKALQEGMDLVQVLSMESDGAWVRFIERKDMIGWKVYIPVGQILSMAVEDEAWPKS